MAIPQLQPSNPFGNFLAGQQAAQENQAQTQENALRGMRLSSAQNVNALSQNPNATPEQYIRAGDPQTGNALAANQDKSTQDKQQALSQLGGLAQKALAIPDPAQRKAFLTQAAPAYAEAFSAMGVDHNKGLQELETLPDDQLDQRLKQVAQFAPQQKPVEVAKGGTLAVPDNAGGYKAAFTAPTPESDTIGKVNPADFTPGSVDVYKKTGNFSDLKRTYAPSQGQAAAASSVDAYKNDPALRRTAAVVVASDPARMRDYATFGAAGQGIRTQINQEIGALKKETGMSDGDFVSARARAKADASNLTKLTAQNAQIQQAEGLLKANGQRVLDLIEMVDQTGIPLIEGFRRSAKAKAGGVNEAELRSVVQTFQTEAARLLTSGPTMNGVISDGARHELASMVPDSMSAAQAKRVINRIFTEADIRQKLNEDQIGKAASGTVVGAQPTPQPAAAAPPAAAATDTSVPTATGPGGQKLFLRNGQWAPQ